MILDGLPVASGRRCNCDRLRQLKIKHRLRGQLDLLSFGHPLHSGPCRSSSTGSNGRAFAAARDGPDDGSERCAAAYRGSRALTASRALAVPLVGRDLVTFAVDVEGVDLNS